MLQPVNVDEVIDAFVIFCTEDLLNRLFNLSMGNGQISQLLVSITKPCFNCIELLLL